MAEKLLARGRRPQESNGRRRLRGKSVLAGLRIDTETARALRVYAESMAESHDAPVNLAAAARDLIRRGLKVYGGDHQKLCHREGFYAGVVEARKMMAQGVRQR